MQTKERKHKKAQEWNLPLSPRKILCCDFRQDTKEENSDFFFHNVVF